MSKFWTAEEDSQLVTLNNMGLSASQIAPKMGRTRNAIIGRINRLKGCRLTRSGRHPPADTVTWSDAKLLDFWRCIDPLPGEEKWSYIELGQKFGISPFNAKLLEERLRSELAESEERHAA